MGVDNEVAMVRKLSNLWVGQFRLFVSIARFHRSQSKQVFHQPKPNLRFKLNSSGTPPVRLLVWLLDHKDPMWLIKQKVRLKNIVLETKDLLQLDDSTKVLIAKVREVDSMTNLYAICKNEGFEDLTIKHAGGLWVWFEFQWSAACMVFQKNISLKGILKDISPVSRNFEIDEIMIWIEVEGLPLCAWSSNAFKKIAAIWGKFMFFENKEEVMSCGRMCICTKQKSLISDSISVKVEGIDYSVRVRELYAWLLDIKDNTSEPEVDSNEKEMFEDESLIGSDDLESQNGVKVADETVPDCSTPQKKNQDKEVKDGKLSDINSSPETPPHDAGQEQEIDKPIAPTTIGSDVSSPIDRTQSIESVSCPFGVEHMKHGLEKLEQWNDCSGIWGLEFFEKWIPHTCVKENLPYKHL